MLKSAGMARQIVPPFSRWACAACLLATLAAGAVVGEAYARVDEQRRGFESDLGLTSGTVYGTVFTLAFSGAYYIDRNFLSDR